MSTFDDDYQRAMAATEQPAKEDDALRVVRIFARYKAVARRENMKREGIPESAIETAIANRWLSRNRGGAVSLTDAGLVAIGSGDEVGRKRNNLGWKSVD